MKKINYLVLTLLLAGSIAQAQNTVKLSESVPANSSDYHLEIMNINGAVNVLGYSGTEIQVSAVEKRKDQEYQLKLIQDRNYTLIYLDGPGVEVKKKDYGWSYNVNSRNNGRNDGIEAHYDITVKVPNNLTVKASTINKGDVKLTQLNGPIHANNINGHVRVENVNSEVEANTVNGDIWVQSNKTPAQNTKFNTVNGEVHLEYPTDFNGSVKYASLHGEFYTDYDYSLGTDISKKKNDIVKIGANSLVKIGNAEGPKVEVNTVNGSIYLKKGKK
jgi:hypothetical protein